jgi:capsular polysaccharide biosynthesis protein
MTLLPLTLSPCRNAREFAAACKAHGLTFTPYGPAAEAKKTVAERHNGDLALLDTPFTTNWLEDYFKRQAGGVARVGILEATGALVTDDWGLVITREGGFVVNAISGFGWTQDQFNYMAEHSHLATGKDGTLALETDGRELVPLQGTAALLSFPGAYTYGHWITDMCGRLELLAAQYDITAIEHFLLPKRAPWMDPFLAAYGVPEDRIIELDKVRAYVPERLLVPTTLGQHHRGALPVRFARQVFRRLEGISRTWGRLPKWGKKIEDSPVIYVRHTALTSAPGRELANEDELIAVIEEMGGRVLDPLKLPLPAFLNRLREASLVVGLDSSALHNLAMAPADLIVIQTEPRFNMLHASIQEAKGKRVGFMRAEKGEDGTWSVAPKRLRTLIRQAQATHR